MSMPVSIQPIVTVQAPLSGVLRQRFFLWLTIFASSGLTAFGASRQGDRVDDSPVDILEALVVTGERLSVSDVEGPNSIEQYDATQVEDSGAFSLNDFFETLPPGENGDEILVLIDGEPAYIDPASLPLGMIEGIEVSTDGSMAKYGARTAGRVINLRLRKDYAGSEIGARYRQPFAGGGEQSSAKASVSIVRGKFRVISSIDRDTTDALLAVERPFSRDQDHTALGGRDLRLSWGYPAVVEATAGSLAGITDGNGNPVSVALVPEFRDGGALTASDFLPGIGSGGAADQQRFNTSVYRMLITPSQRTRGTFELKYTASPQLNLALSASYSDQSGHRRSAPPVSEVSPETVVPAEYNPFGQDIAIGLVHVEFGPTLERSISHVAQVGLQAGGRIGESWQWRSGVRHEWGSSHRIARDLDAGKFSAALAAADPAARFDPFGDASAGPVNAHLYPDLSIERTRIERSADTRVDLSANGDLARLPGGSVRLALRGNQRWRERDRTESNLREGDDRLRRDRRSTQAVSASVSVPLIGDANAAPWLRRLTTEISGEYSTGSDHSSEREGEFGLAWAPVKQLVFRANVSAETESASHLVDAQSETLVGETLVDPRHDSALVSDVQEIIRRISDVLPETSLRRSIGFTFEPERLRGLRLTARYDHRMRRHLFEDRFDLQDLINNEAGFPDRVQRAEPTAEDLAAGRPGRIVAVDVTPGSVGSAETSDIDFSLNYRVPSERLGRVQVAIEGTRLLESKREIAPGVSFLNEGDSRYHPPDWRARGSLSWAWKSWNTSLRVRYTGAIVATAIGGEIPAHTEVDWNMGYRFREGVWGSFGKGLRVTLGLDNVFDAAPAFADTIDGYRGGSPLGRTVSMAFTLPL